jgi:DNA-directed RNA polymerase specialized sigma24 family protein
MGDGMEGLMETVERIVAAVEESERKERKTVLPFVAKVLAEAEGDRQKLEEALKGLSVEQRIAVKMAWGREGRN